MRATHNQNGNVYVQLQLITQFLLKSITQQFTKSQVVLITGTHSPVKHNFQFEHIVSVHKLYVHAGK